MTDFEPQTDLPHQIETDDQPVASSARLRDEAVLQRRKLVLRLVLVGVTAGLLLAGFDWFRVLVAVAIMYAILVAGTATLGAFARPVPGPPPEGELRKVKLNYRCTLCGAELKMTLAAEQEPEAPRHCSDEMELVAATDDI